MGKIIVIVTLLLGGCSAFGPPTYNPYEIYKQRGDFWESDTEYLDRVTCMNGYAVCRRYPGNTHSCYCT